MPAGGVTASAAQQLTATIFRGSSSASAEPMSVAAQTFVPKYSRTRVHVGACDPAHGPRYHPAAQAARASRAAAESDGPGSCGAAAATSEATSEPAGTTEVVAPPSTHSLRTTFRRLYMVCSLWGVAVTAIVYAVMSPPALRLFTSSPGVWCHASPDARHQRHSLADAHATRLLRCLRWPGPLGQDYWDIHRYEHPAAGGHAFRSICRACLAVCAQLESETVLSP